MMARFGRNRRPLQQPVKWILAGSALFAVTLILPWARASFGTQTYDGYWKDLKQGQAAVVATAVLVVLTVRHALGRQTINQVKGIAAAGAVGAISTIWYWSKVPTGRVPGIVDSSPTIWLYGALAGSIVAGVSALRLMSEY